MKSHKTDDLIALICKAATEKYREDRVRPGIQIAHIPVEQVATCFVGTPEQAQGAKALGLKHGDPVLQCAFWYVALHRYPNDSVTLERYQPLRKVVHTAKHEDLDRAVQLLALQLLPVEAQAELAEAIRGVKAS